MNAKAKDWLDVTLGGVALMLFGILVFGGGAPPLGYAMALLSVAFSCRIALRHVRDRRGS